MYSKFNKRLWSAVLAFAMILSTFSFGALFVSAAEPTDGTVTDGQIVADGYAQLTEAEKKLISSGYLIGSTHNYQVPDADDNLISVETGTKTITAKTYEGTNGYLWVPVSAVIEASGREQETVQFNGTETATYTYGGDAFAVKVKYELSLNVDEGTQKELLSAPSYLQQALAVMDSIADAREKLSAMELQDVVDILEKLNSEDGYGMDYEIPSVPPQILTVTMKFRPEKIGDSKYAEKDAATALLAQMAANAGNKLNISVIADEYAAAESKLEYIVNNADRIQTELVNAYDYLYAITRDGCVLITAANNLPDSDSLKSVLTAFVNNLKSAATHLNTASGKAASLASSKSVIKSGLTTVQYQALDTLTLALGNATLTGAGIAPTNPLVADTTTIQFNMAMFDVTAKVVLELTKDEIGSTDLVIYDTKSVVLTLTEGVTAAEIEQAVKDAGIENSALLAWTTDGKYVAGQFVASVSALPATLTEDIEYVITYTPVSYTLTYLDEPAKSVPYGYQFMLPIHGDSEKAYDYTVEAPADIETYYAQGTRYTVTTDTKVTREEGKSYTGYTVNGLIADIYFSGNDKAQSILNSGALTIGNDAVMVRVPDNSTGIVTLTGDELKAKKYPSSYNGLEWTPYSYTIVRATGNETKYFAGADTVTITGAQYDRVEVTYRLTLTNLDDAYILQAAQLPATLVTEANAQMKVLNTLNGNKSAMTQVTKAVLNAVKGVVAGDETISQMNRDKIVDVITGIVDNCIDADGNLKIYNMMVQYSDPNNGGLYYYYQNSAAIIKEIKTLAGYLNTLLGDGSDTELRDVLVNLIETSLPQYADKVDQLDKIKGYVNDAAAIAPPNAAINLSDAAALEKLTEALETDGTVATISSVDDLYIDAPIISVAAQNKITITASVSKPGVAPIAIPGQTFDKDHVLTQGDVNQIIAELTSAIATLNASDKYYTTNYNVSEIEALVGQTVSELAKIDFTYTWTPKTFTVTVEGVAGYQEITIDNLGISLPAGPAGIRYEYWINGGKVGAGSFKFTPALIDALFVGGTYHIEREETDLSKAELIQFVNDLNAAIGNNGIVFALTENASGEYAIVMKINAANTGDLPSAVKGMAMELAQSYSYIAFGNNALVYEDAAAGTKVSIQAIINTVMSSSFGTNTLAALMDANGNISNIALPGTVISAKAMSVAGGKLAQTTLVLGSSAAAPDYTVPMYITLGSAPSYLTQLRNLLVNQLAPYFDFTCDNGKINVGLNLPKKAYEAYLAVLLASDYADLADINSINEDVALGFMMDVFHPLISSDASASSVQNTLAKFGYNIDLVSYNEAFEALRKIYKSTTFGYNSTDSTYDANANVSIKGFIDSMNLGSLGGLIAEANTGLDFALAINLDNLDKKYEALYFDIGAAGITNKFGLVEDLSAKLGDIAGTAIVILLDDVNSNLTFGTTTVLNLNGKKVTGNIVGNASLRIIDTIINTGVVGSVTGTISGNVKIAGGMYTADISAFLTEGYAQDASGVVENQFFNLVKESDGSISVKLNAGMLATNKLPDIRTLAVDIIAEILANGFTANKLYVDGNKVYEITVDDLIGIYTGTDRKNTVISKIMDMIDVNALKTLANSVLADITDFDGMYAIMADNIANGTELPLLSYQITTGTWGISLDYVAADDSITASIVSNDNKDRALNIVITGNDADKQHFANLLGILAETTDATVEIDKVTGNKVPGGFNFEFGISGDIKVDMTSDPKYAIMLSVIVADGIGASANADLVAGLKTYFETNDMQDLADAFNKLTVAQIITAIKNVQRGDSFTAMLTALGLDGYNAADAIALEAETGAFIKLLGALLRRVSITGTSTPLGAFIDATTGAYTIDKQNIKRAVSVTVGGYTFTLNAELVDFFASVKIFGTGVTLVDYSELQNQINIAESKVESEYTAASWADLQTALTAAKAALSSLDQAEVDKAAKDLADAIAALVKLPTPIDYSELRYQINKAQYLSEQHYTAESWANMKMALANAISALASTSQAEVDAAALALKDAIAALVKVSTAPALDYSALIDQMIRADQLKEDEYTAESWAAMRAVLEEVAAKLWKCDFQYEVDEATAKLKNAIDSLVKKPAPSEIDYTALKNQIATAERLIESKYTADSWAVMKAAWNAATAALTSLDQAEVDAAAKALGDAIGALVLKSSLVDYTELMNQIAIAKGLTKTDYTATSWANMQTALKAATAALNSDVQAEVDAAENALRKALAALEKVTVPGDINYTELKNQIAAAEKLAEEAYTAASWATMKTAWNAAITALLTADTQAEVDAAATALKNAIAALVKLPVSIDYSELKAQIAAAEKLKESDYTAGTWTVVKQALTAAKEALASITQSEVDAAAEALRVAMIGLNKIDYTELQNQIAAAEKLTEGDYTAESWTALKDALTAAKAALTNLDQTKVDAAALALKNAIVNLDKKPAAVDYTELNNQIAAAEKLTEGDYTASSWAAVKSALDAAKAALTSTEQSEVDAAAAALKVALSALVEKYINYNELKNQIAVAEKLTEGDYDAEDWAVLTGALDAAKAALTSKDQAVVDAAALALKNAIEALGDKTVIWPWIVFPSIVVVAGAGVGAYFLIKKKKKPGDDTPLVDYDISDDN